MGIRKFLSIAMAVVIFSASLGSITFADQYEGKESYTRAEFAKYIIDSYNIELEQLPANLKSVDKYTYTVVRKGLYKGVSFDFEGIMTSDDMNIVWNNLDAVDIISKQDDDLVETTTLDNANKESNVKFQTEQVKTEYVPLTETLGIWTRAEYNEFDKKNLWDENFSSIEGFSKAIYDSGIYTVEEIESFLKTFETAMINLSWWAIEKGHYADYIANAEGIVIYYYSSPTKDEKIFSVKIIPKSEAFYENEGIMYEYGFRVHRLYAYGEIDDFGGHDSFMEYSYEHNHVFPDYVKAVAIAADAFYKEDGSKVTELLTSEIGRIEYSFENVIDERKVNVGYGNHLLTSDKKMGEQGFSYVGLWAEQNSVFGVDR